jgi:hypothetical protein
MEVLEFFAEANKKQIDETVATVRNLVAKLDAAEEEWRARNDVPVNWTGKVKIDVGGKKFFTTLPVLLAKGGFFHCGRSWWCDKGQ